MFGLFKAKPPISAWEKAWTEYRLCELAEQFGMKPLLETPTLVPSFEGIPSVANLGDAEQLLEFLQTWLKLDSGKIRLQLFTDVVAPESISSFDDNEHVIQVTDEELLDRDELVAKFANSLIRQAFIRNGLAPATTSDDEWIIDLLPTFLGLGIFIANRSDRPSQNAVGSIAWWSPRQRATLPARMTGYALALRSVVRNELEVPWTQSLRHDAQIAFADGMNFLQKSGDTIFARELLTQPRRQFSEDTLVDELNSGSPSAKITAMWGLSERVDRRSPEPNGRIGDLIRDAIRHKQPEVRAVAAETLPLFDRSIDAAQDLCDALSDSSEEVRIASAGALAAYPGVDDESLVFDLTRALKDDDRLVVFNAARSLTAYGKAAESAVKTLLQRLRRAAVECREQEALTIVWALNAIADDAPTVIRDFFSDGDEEFEEYALQLLEQVTSEATQTT